MNRTTCSPASRRRRADPAQPARSAGTVPPMRFRVLGPVHIQTADATVLTLARRQERSLLGILLLHPGQAVAMDRLCDLIWDDDPPEHARPAIRTYVARIRAVLARADAPASGVRLISHNGGYLLEPPPELVDAPRFRSLLHEATGAAPATRQRLLQQAIELWRGPALDRAATDRLRRRLCADLDELRLNAIEEAMAAGVELGQHRQLLPDLNRLTAEHPT